MGRELTEEEVAEFAELRARNLQELAELREDIERRKKITVLDLHRRPEPEPEKKPMFSDDAVTRIIEALKAETAMQLRDHHDYLRALVQEVYLDLYKSAKGMKKDIATLRRELAELRTEAKAIQDGTVTVIRKQQERA